MLQFQTLDDILDFAIVQEIAAQEFYTKLSHETPSNDMQLFYRTLAEEEQTHEKELRKLKRRRFDLVAPDLSELQKSGYLDALPISPEMSLKDVLLYALKKERSAKMLYGVMADNMKQKDLVDLFKTLADQEAKHADFFRKEYDDVCAKTD
ncbi:MAG: ferritin family protein [Syntrophaceae bacterium]|nr:ferritin family protein [Syntrophaceae bacterium]